MAECRILIDANTLISGIVFRGNEHQLLLNGKTAGMLLLTPRDAVDEVRKTLAVKFPGESRLFDLFLELSGVRVIEKSIYSSDLHKYAFVRDPEDRYVLAAAVNSGCGYIVSGDKDLLTIGEYKGVKIKTTGDMLKIMKRV
jgi:putative PIN family toxin of toxin-antitoxin system